jgi:hypothetical protein
MPARYLSVACGVIARPNAPPLVDRQEVARQRQAAALAANFWRSLVRTRDMTPLLDQYFADDFTDRMLGESDTEWLGKLSPQTATQLSPEGLRRYYAAVINAQFLGTILVIEKSNAGADPTAPAEQVISPSLISFVDRQPYAAKYRTAPNDYAYLGETIDNVERARGYTELLENTNGLLRRQLGRNLPAHFLEYSEEPADAWNYTRWDFTPDVRVCEKACFGLPAGTRLYVTDVPLVKLQMANIDGRQRIVSAVVTTPE